MAIKYIQQAQHSKDIFQFELKTTKSNYKLHIRDINKTKVPKEVESE